MSTNDEEYDIEPCWDSLRKQVTRIIENPGFPIGDKDDAVSLFRGPEQVYVYQSDLPFPQGRVGPSELIIGINVAECMMITCKIGDIQWDIECIAGFNYILPETIIPTICLRFHPVSFWMQEGKKAKLIKGHFRDREDSRYVCMSMNLQPWWTKTDQRYLLFTGGMMGTASSEPPSRNQLPAMPKMGPSIEDKIRWQEIIDEDLKKSAWHPDRLINWCLDEDEKRDMDLISSATTISSGFWMDDVYVADCRLSEHAWNSLSALVLRTVGQRTNFIGLVSCVHLHDILKAIVGTIFNGRLKVSQKETSMVTIGHHMYCNDDSEFTLAPHIDNPINGGELSILLYLNDHDASIVFDEFKIIPRRGRIVLLPIDKIHHVEPTTMDYERHTSRLVIGCEVVWSPSSSIES